MGSVMGNSLTATKVASSKLKPGNYPDGDGLLLQVSNSGTKSWGFRFRLNGKAREMGLGRVAEVTLAQAREKAADARKLVNQGIDPITARQQSKQEQQEASEHTFARAMELYIAHAVETGTWSDRLAEQNWRQSLRDYAIPHIGTMPVDKITPADVLKCLSPIWRTKPETGNKLRHRVYRVLSYAKTILHWRDGPNPAEWRDNLDSTLVTPKKVKPVEHRAAMPWEDVPAFMARLRAQDDTVARMLEFMILTAVRTKPLFLATWREIDLTARVWTIPGPHEKGRKEHRVPLPDRAAAILEAIKPADAQPQHYVFASDDGPLVKRGHASMWNLMKELGVYGTPHGFRSSFRDWAGENGHNTDAAEAALSHRLGNAVRASYQRGSLFGIRQSLMADWAAFCDTVVELKRAA